MSKARAAARAARRQKTVREPAATALADRLERAVAFHRRGRVDKAEPLYRTIIRQAPRHHIALHLLGVVALERGDLDAAEELIGRALEVVPDYPEALNNRGNVYFRTGRFADALASYDAALALRPGFVDALNNRGNALRQGGRLQEALASYDAALAVGPDHADALRNRADLLVALDRPEEALAAYDAALAARPDWVPALFSRARIRFATGRTEDALADYDRLVALRPDIVEALVERGNTLMLLQRWADALADYEAVLAAMPDRVETLSNRGDALRALGRRDEALASLEAALAIDPGFVEALNNRGNVLLELNRVEEALASYDRALAITPDYTDALTNRGNALKALTRLDEALACYAAALATDPENALARWNDGCCRLLMGDFERGWPGYEWRWRTELKNARRAFAQPLWLGCEPVAGRTILLHAEQGLGDTIQFCRLAADVAARGARVILEVQPPLEPLLQGLAGVDRLIARGDPLPDFDMHCPLLSLPLALGIRLETIPAPRCHISADGAAVSRWSARLGDKARPRVGLAWSGNPRQKNDRNRSIPLAALAPLTRIDADFFALQRDMQPEDAAALADGVRLRFFGHDVDAFTDTAALMSLMDVVVSVDTSLAHLAGALGRPTWILLSWAHDWRWLLDREDSAWYPTARLFRQSERGDWSGVLRKVTAELQALHGQAAA